LALTRGQLGERSLADAAPSFQSKRAAGPGVVERRFDEEGDVAWPEHEGRGQVDLALVVREPALGEDGELIAETNDVAVRNADSPGAYASNESATRTFEVLEVNAVGANLDPRMTWRDIGSDDPNVGPFIAADHRGIARGDDLDATVLARKYESPSAFNRAALLVKTRRLRLFALVARLVRRYPRLISLCHRSLFSALSVHAGRTAACG
jgi:hypothetical protein